MVFKIFEFQGPNGPIPDQLWKYLNELAKPKFFCTFYKMCPIKVESLERFYCMASSIVTRPRLGNSKIFDARLESGHAFYLADNTLSREDGNRLKLTFDQQITPDDYKFLREIAILRMVLTRRLTRRDRTSTVMVEVWNFDEKSIKVFPMAMAMEDGYNDIEPDIAYTMTFDNSEFKTSVILPPGESDKNSPRTIAFVLKIHRKLKRWANEPLINVNNWRTFSRSNSFVQPVPYLETYDKLKEIHYTNLCEIWENLANKSADQMKKDIHEDLAIATYLHHAISYINTKYTSHDIRSFVDVGCGNGLLTFLLTNLGWMGYGIDCRRRKVWDMLGLPIKKGKKKQKAKITDDEFELVMGLDTIRKADLRESVVTPNGTQFERDGMRIFIGNHPDELTPWIPVIARKSQSHFIIIPCCPYNFDGTKFQNKTKMKDEKMTNALRRQGNKLLVQECGNQPDKNVESQAVEESSIDVNSGVVAGTIQGLSNEAGVADPCADRHINGNGKQEDMSPNSAYQQYLAFIEHVATECGYIVLVDRLRIPSTRRVAIFGLYDSKRARSKLERSHLWPDIKLGLSWFKSPTIPEVNNCTTLPREEIDRVVFTIFEYLICESTVEDMFFLEGYTQVWNRGSQIVCLGHIIYKVLKPYDRAIFRDQAKGLQTLIKNHSHIFKLNSAGLVSLRVPTPQDVDNVKKKNTLQTKPCYFRVNHPDGCPLPDNMCAFRHQGVYRCTDGKNTQRVQINQKNGIDGNGLSKVLLSLPEEELDGNDHFGLSNLFNKLDV